MIITFRKTVEIQIHTELIEFAHIGRIEKTFNMVEDLQEDRLYWMNNNDDFHGTGLVFFTHDLAPVTIHKLEANESLKTFLNDIKILPEGDEDIGFVEIWFAETKQNHEYLFKLLSQEINESDN